MKKGQTRVQNSPDKNPVDFEELFNRMLIPRLVICPASGSYIVAQVNDVALKFFGRSREKVLGQDIAAFMDAENARHFIQSFEVCLGRKKTVSIQTLPTVPGDLKVYAFWVNPIFGEDGNISCLDVLGQIDARSQSILQRERDDAISMLASIFEVSEVGIIVIDQEGRIVRVNDSFVRTYGWTRDELLGNDFATLVTPDEREKARVNHRKYISVGVRSSGEIPMLRKDKSVANVLFTCATLELSQNRKFLVTTVMDITLRKQMEQSLRHAKEQADTANRAKSSFLANMSHELRTPLNAILGFSEMMLKEVFGPLGGPKYKEYLGDVHMSAEHLLQIINEVLDMSKIEAGRLEIQEEHVDVADLISGVTRMMASKVLTSDTEIVSAVAEDLPPLLADQRLMRQIMINLLTNAIKFSPHGGMITVKAFVREEGDFCISISDQGIGIPQGKIPQALAPFGQVSDRPDTSDTRQQGTGLGLPLAKAMMEMHGGTLSLESEFGKGTTAVLSFPRQRVVDVRI